MNFKKIYLNGSCKENWEKKQCSLFLQCFYVPALYILIVSPLDYLFQWFLEPLSLKRALFIILAYSVNFYGCLHDFLSWDLAIEANHDYENVETKIVLNQAKLLISCFPVKISINCFSLAFTKSLKSRFKTSVLTFKT